METEIENLAELVEIKLKKRFNRKLIGLSSGLTVIIAIISFIGYGTIEKAVIQSLTNKYLKNEEIKNEIILNVTNSLTTESKIILTELKDEKSEIDKIIEEIYYQHEEIINATNLEFQRTIDVLQKIRANGK